MYKKQCLIFLIIFFINVVQAQILAFDQAYWNNEEELQTSAEAQYELGILHLTQKEVIKNSEVKALYWFRRAALQGHVLAQYSLAVMYYMGKGVNPDFILAYAWMDIASFNMPVFAKARDMFATKMSDNDIAEAELISQKLFQEITKNQFVLN